MRGWPGRLGGWACWALLVAAVLGHAVLGLLAIAEFATLGWPLMTWFDTGAVTVVLASALAGLTASTLVAVRAAAGWRAVRALIGTDRCPVPRVVQAEAAVLSCAARLDAVDGEEAFAVTYGLIRPRILISTGLARVLTRAEIGAVLAHEAEHIRCRDPLRLLAFRLLAAVGCYVPACRWLASRAALRRELAADRAATGAAGRGVLAGALLKLASMPAVPAVAAAGPDGDAPRSLEARVAQLEAGRLPHQRLAVRRLLASAGTLSVLAPAFLCCAAISQVLPGGLL
jgi:hypothetical protein